MALQGKYTKLEWDFGDKISVDYSKSMRGLFVPEEKQMTDTKYQQLEKQLKSNQELLQKVTEKYGPIAMLARKYDLTPDLLFDYIDFIFRSLEQKHEKPIKDVFEEIAKRLAEDKDSKKGRALIF